MSFYQQIPRSGYYLLRMWSQLVAIQVRARLKERCFLHAIFRYLSQAQHYIHIFAVNKQNSYLCNKILQLHHNYLALILQTPYLAVKMLKIPSWTGYKLKNKSFEIHSQVIKVIIKNLVISIKPPRQFILLQIL